jgi:LPXTG-motif cell wall-anchored protein
MTPISNTIYTVALFLALVALLFWLKRRRRASGVLRRSILMERKD